jgi:hypothetical protein
MGDFFAILSNYIIINNIWICKSTSNALIFLMLHCTNKAWKNSVDGSKEWAHCRFCLFKFWSQEERMFELHKLLKKQECNPKSCSNWDECNGEVSFKTSWIWIESKCPGYVHNIVFWIEFEYVCLFFF